MKMNQQLEKEQIHKFLMIVSKFHRKINSYKHSQKDTFIENFYDRVQVFFHKYNSAELYSYFLKINVDHITSKSFMSSFGLDIDQEAETEHNSNKFHIYMESIVPKEESIISKSESLLKASLTDTSGNDGNTDEMLQTVVSKLNMNVADGNRNDRLIGNPKFMDDISLDPREIDEDEEKTEGELDGDSEKVEEKKMDIINDLDMLEEDGIEKDNYDHFGYLGDDDLNNLSKEIQDSKDIRQEPGLGDINNFVDSSFKRAVYDKKEEGGLKTEILQKREEIVIIKQKRVSSLDQDGEEEDDTENSRGKELDEEQNDNWVYLYGQPYEFKGTF